MKKISKDSQLTITFNCYNPDHKCREQYSFTFNVHIDEEETQWLLVSTRGAGHGIAKTIRDMFPCRMSSSQGKAKTTLAHVRKILERKFSLILDFTTNSYTNPDPKGIETYPTYSLIKPLRDTVA